MGLHHEALPAIDSKQIISSWIRLEYSTDMAG